MRKKDLIQLIIAGILIIVLIFLVSNALKRKRSRDIRSIKPEITEAAVLGAAVQVNNPEDGDLYNTLEKLSNSIELKRDPFTAVPIVVVEKTSSELSLEGINYDSGNSLAVINNRVVKIGSKVGVYTVIGIKRNSVILSDGISNLELKLGS